jgi:DNA-binding transcriptional LysR family regulator
MTALDIPTVQAFLLVAELESFTRAAEALGTTQAAVSMKLQRLESALGKRMAERSPQRGWSRRNCRSASATTPQGPNWCR